MILLEDLYKEVLLNEKLSDINISSETIQKELDKQYSEYRARDQKLHRKEITFPNQQNDVDIIKRVLALVNDQDKSFTHIINNFLKNGSKRKLKVGLAMVDQRWKHNILSQELGWDFKNQALNLTIFEILNTVGLVNFPVTMNEQGFPKYPKHLINKYVAMNVLEQMFIAEEITPDQKDIVDGFLFDEQTKSSIQLDIDQYVQRTTAQFTEEPVTPEPEFVEPISESIGNTNKIVRFVLPATIDMSVNKDEIMENYTHDHYLTDVKDGLSEKDIIEKLGNIVTEKAHLKVLEMAEQVPDMDIALAPNRPPDIKDAEFHRFSFELLLQDYKHMQEGDQQWVDQNIP